MPHLVKKGFLTTCLTTDSFGTHGNSGVKRCGEYAETSRNYRKWPEMYRKNLVQPFGSVMPAAWASAFRPLRFPVWRKLPLCGEASWQGIPSFPAAARRVSGFL